MKRRVIHPFLFALFPILSLYLTNASELSIRLLAVPFAVALTGTTVLFLVFVLLQKDTHRSGLIVLAFVMLFSSYGHAAPTLPGVPILWPAAFAIVTALLIKTRRDLSVVTGYANIVALVLVVMVAAQISFQEVGKVRQARLADQATVVNLEGKQTQIPKGRLPDIYLIVLDAYARQDVLAEVYEYDNRPFLDELKGLGFFVAKDSSSNYRKTDLTLSSSLNLDYLDDLVLDPDSESGPAPWLLRHNKVFDFLRKLGYTIAAFSSGYTLTEIDTADLYIKPDFFINGFQNALINTTPLPSLLRQFETSDQFDLHRKRILNTLDKLPEVAKGHSPCFVFAHLTVPHPPFVFGENGQARTTQNEYTLLDGDWLIDRGQVSRAMYLRSYIDQIKFINKRALEVVKTILAESEVPPIIVLMGDHGPRSMLIWEEPENTYMKECMTNLCAVHLPGDTNALYDRITPVNLFRMILKSAFGLDFERLKDRNYYSSVHFPYRFYDVTDRVSDPHQEVIHNRLGIKVGGWGDLNRAIHHFSAAIRVNPNFAKAHYNLGISLLAKNQVETAVGLLTRAAALEPTDPDPRIRLASTLASHPEAKHRDGRRAVDLALEAIALQARPSPASLDTLAAALAENEQFDDAIREAEKALAMTQKDSDLAKQIQSRLRLYRTGRPFHQAKP